MSSEPESSVEMPSRLFDFQINGFGGVDFQRDGLTAAQLRHAVASMRRHRVGAIYLTLITDDVDRLCRRFEAIERLRKADADANAIIAGYHLEGPWVSPEPGFRGAHPAGPMHAPSLAEWSRLQSAAGGNIRLVTLAPEWPGSAEVIRAIVSERVHVSLGHTDASEQQIDEAIRAGARFATHLGNGAPQMMHRHDNIIQRLLARDELIACFIPDGIHVPPFALRNFVRAKPAGQIAFTTDAMSGAGASPGRYTLGPHEIELGADGIARNPGGQGFAGSALTPDEGVRRVARILNLSLAESLHLWTDAAAKMFGVTLPAG